MGGDASNDGQSNGETKNDYPSLTRAHSTYKTLPTFDLEKERQYKQQYGDIYFERLALLKPAVEEVAQEAWGDFELAGESATKVDRVLDVRQGQLCWVAGTVYMDMALKPNVLEDISKDHWISAPPPRQSYFTADGSDQVMLEDESGRIRLIGGTVGSQLLVTGCVIAVLGTEKATGDFEVIDIRLPELAPQPSRWSLQSPPSNANENSSTSSNKIAFISGLSINGTTADTLTLEMLLEFLLGEAGSPSEQAIAASISRLVILGNSLSDASPLDPNLANVGGKNKPTVKKYGYDSSAYNPAPTAHLDLFLSILLPSLPVTILPGPSDPSSVALPQQPLHTALFARSRAYAAAPSARGSNSNGKVGGPGWFDPTTNPFDVEIEGWRMLLAANQTVDDILRYKDVEDTPSRLPIMEQMLRWRCAAPTAPDTLWCYPYQEDDPFVLRACPHVYAAGDMPKYESRILEGDHDQTVRLLAVPNFRETGTLVLLDAETLETETMKFEIWNEKK